MGERELEVDLATFAAALDAGAPVLDVRRPHEFFEAHVPGARLVPLEELGERLHEIPKDRRVYLICAVGARSLAAAEMLSSAGWDAVSVAGGTEGWLEQGRPVLDGLR